AKRPGRRAWPRTFRSGSSLVRPWNAERRQALLGALHDGLPGIRLLRRHVRVERPSVWLGSGFAVFAGGPEQRVERGRSKRGDAAWRQTIGRAGCFAVRAHGGAVDGGRYF